MTQMVATAGRADLEEAPSNAALAGVLSGVEMAARASLVICNGGSPTTHQALAAGVPVLGVAGNMNQQLNMETIRRAGPASCSKPQPWTVRTSATPCYASSPSGVRGRSPAPLGNVCGIRPGDPPAGPAREDPHAVASGGVKARQVVPQAPAGSFRYDDEAFSRTLGWLTAEERQRLRQARRRGRPRRSGGQSPPHPDAAGHRRFPPGRLRPSRLANFNRQAGARMSTLGRPKVDVLCGMARTSTPRST